MGTNHYDVIFAGGGCSGLTLAAKLAANEKAADKRMLVIERERTYKYDKTWCYWSRTNGQEPFPVHDSWSEIRFGSDDREKRQAIQPYRYYCVRNDHYLDALKKQLLVCPNVEFVQEEVLATTETGDVATVQCTNSAYTADWVFNSVPSKPAIGEQDIWLWQHFKGRVVKTAQPFFDVSRMTLMDFDTPQSGEARFFYVLPFSETEALVEFTVFSETKMSSEEYDPYIEAYLAGSLGLSEYETVHVEEGAIPMTNARFPEKTGERIYHIGATAGLTKPTTGYTFRRILADSERIAEHFSRHGRPVARQARSKKFAFYDDLLLWIIKNKGHRVSGIMQRLFYKSDFRLILKFLDEETSVWEDARIFSRLPWAVFLQALFQYYLLKKP